MAVALVDADMPYLVADASPFVIRTSDAPATGTVSWQSPMQFAAFHWSTLWSQLRRRVPDDRYHRAAVVADGYQSLGRRLLFPDVDLHSRGYQLWRGLLPEAALADPDVLGSNCPRISYPTMPGNFVCCFVPGEDGSTRAGERWCAPHNTPTYSSSTTRACRRTTGALPA